MGGEGYNMFSLPALVVKESLRFEKVSLMWPQAVSSGVCQVEGRGQRGWYSRLRQGPSGDTEW